MRITEQEKKAIEEKAKQKNLTLSAYLRSLCFHPEALLSRSDQELVAYYSFQNILKRAITIVTSGERGELSDSEVRDGLSYILSELGLAKNSLKETFASPQN